MGEQIRTFSSGGGVQSTAALVLSAQGRIDFPVHLFSNVGDDSEHPATLKYVREVLVPYAEANGIEFHELQRIKRDGTTETLYGRLTKEGSRSLPIPVRMRSGAPATRSCTIDFKIRVLSNWHKAHGATEANPALVGIGFSTDEIERIGNASKKARRPWEEPNYPLIELGLSRADCMDITARAGLPPAPKSSCWFCPMHRPSVWREMRRDEPELFWQAVNLESTLNKRRADLRCPGSGEALVEPKAGQVPGTMECPVCSSRFGTLTGDGVTPEHGRDPVFLTWYAKPLDQAIGEAQPTLFGSEDESPWAGDTCDEGVCFI